MDHSTPSCLLPCTEQLPVQFDHFHKLTHLETAYFRIKDNLNLLKVLGLFIHVWICSNMSLTRVFLIDLCFYVHAGKPELRSEVDIIVADVGEPDSLAAMCKQAVIVLNCVGPVSRQLHRNVWPNSLSVSLASSLEHRLSYTQSCLHLNKGDH